MTTAKTEQPTLNMRQLKAIEYLQAELCSGKGRIMVPFAEITEKLYLSDRSARDTMDRLFRKELARNIGRGEWTLTVKGRNYVI